MSDWNHYIQVGLLDKGLVSGVSLVNNQGLCIYHHGNLDPVKNDWQQVVSAFSWMATKQEDQVTNRGFQLHLSDSGRSNYRIFHKSYCSIYAVSEGGNAGLVVCNLPQGMLIVTHKQGEKATHVIQAVEEFCQPLRA